MMEHIGLFRHYKGGNYVLHAIALDADTNNHIAVYSNEQGVVFTRPAVDFFAHIHIDGQSGAIPRFARHTYKGPKT